MIKIILADDQNIVRNGIRNLLEKDGRFEVIGEASNADELFEIMNKGFVPEIVLADMVLPGMTGLALAEKISSNNHNTKIVLLTIVDNDEQLIQAFKSGAMGYLLKSVSADELIFALSYVHHQNKRYISAALAPQLLDIVSNLLQYDHEGHDGHNGAVFTKREYEVLQFIAEGHTNQQIADKLFTSRRTVEGHRQALMDKADVSNSAALIRYAFQHKLIE
ncbi:MAG: response regulator [Mucilaginibacter sp.]